MLSPPRSLCPFISFLKELRRSIALQASIFYIWCFFKEMSSLFYVPLHCLTRRQALMQYPILNSSRHSQSFRLQGRPTQVLAEVAARVIAASASLQHSPQRKVLLELDGRWIEQDAASQTGPPFFLMSEI